MTNNGYHHAETRIRVDMDTVLRDPALARLEDGPAKRFLLALGHELERARGDGPEALLIVRRA